MIAVENISKTYFGKNNVLAVQNASLEIADGQIAGIIGFSGAGKSTLVRCLNLLERPDSGSIRIKGYGRMRSENGKLFYTEETDLSHPSTKERRASEKDIRHFRSGVGMIFQHFSLLDRLTVFGNIAYPLRYCGKSSEEIESRVRELLKLVGLEEKINSYPSQLSGGQKQRVAIARALANDPKILLCDEATSALDPDATKSILKLLKELNEKLGLTVILITHEMEVVESVCDTVAVMENGKIIEQGKVYDLFANPEKNVTRKFVNSSSNIFNIIKLFEDDSPLFSLAEKGVLVRCIYNREHGAEPIISEVSRSYRVNVNILLADIALLKGVPLGGMIAAISGEDEDIRSAIEFMRNHGIKVEVIADDRVV